MKCPSCNQDNIEGADECAHCGAALYGLRIKDHEGPDFIRRPISEVRKRPLLTVGANDPVALAVRTMQREDVNCVFVKEGDEVLGVITGWDILQKVAGPNEDLVAATCGKVMTPNPYVLNEQDSVALALNAMATGGFRHLLISNDDKPSSMITAYDLFRYLSPHLV